MSSTRIIVVASPARSSSSKSDSPFTVLTERSTDRGATRKALLRVGGRHVVESVLMGYRDRVTVCVSTQVGCAMGCVFCATGQMGLEGNLTAGEIAAQVVWANRAARSLPEWMPRRVTNVVFMGMGEPLANYRATAMAIVRLQDPAGIGLGARHLTVSTVGLVPGIRRLGMDHPQVGLAISLHAADDELRTAWCRRTAGGRSWSSRPPWRSGASAPGGARRSNGP